MLDQNVIFSADAAFLADHKNISFKKIHKKIQKKTLNEIKNCIVLKIEKFTEFYFAQNLINAEFFLNYSLFINFK